MLIHIDQPDVAEKVHNAWLRTIEDGIHTYDVYKEGVSTEKVGTKEFAAAVVARMGRKPEKLKPVSYKSAPRQQTSAHKEHVKAKKDLLGVDVFLDWTPGTPDQLAGILSKVSVAGLKLHMISNRGVKVWPDGMPETFCSDHWRCRFTAAESGATVSHTQIIDVLTQIRSVGLDFIKTENLCAFDGVKSYSLELGE